MSFASRSNAFRRPFKYLLTLFERSVESLKNTFNRPCKKAFEEPLKALKQSNSFQSPCKGLLKPVDKPLKDDVKAFYNLLECLLRAF